MSFTQVFDSRFLRSLEPLTLRVTRHFRSLGRGDRRSRRKGASPEFAEHRPYHSGDDIRQIDWLAYARTEQLVLKEHNAEQDLVVHVLLDTSASMGVLAGDGRSKFDWARQVAAAFVYIALASGDRLRLQLYADGQLGASFGPLRGKRGFPKVLDALAKLEAGGQTGLDEATRRFCARRVAPGLVLVVSDFLEDAAARKGLERLRYGAYEPLAVQTVLAEELEPTLTGDQDLECVETGERLSLTLDRSAARLYREKVQAWLLDFEGFCRKHTIPHLLAPSDASLEQVFLQDLRRARIFQ